MSPVLLIIIALLVLPWLGMALLGRQRRNPKLARLGGVIGLSLAFLFFGAGHFLIDGVLVELLPEWVPGRLGIVWITGLMEFAVAALLLLPRTRRLGGWCAIALLLAFFPANVYGALTQADVGGHALGPVYLLVRGPLQVLLIWWAWYFVLRRPA